MDAYKSIKTAALIGAGMVASTHVHACAGIRHKLRLKSIVSKHGHSAKELAVKASVLCEQDVIAVSSVDTILDDRDIDFVIIATPPDTRADVIDPLIAAGKHILLEKPVGRTFEASERIVSRCEAANVKLGIVFQHRSRMASVKACELIKSGTLGALGVVQINVPWWRDQSYYDEPGRGTYARDGGGVLISQAIHSINLALRLTGPVSTVQSMARTTILHNMESEDFVVAGLVFANGAVGSMIASTASFPGGSESIVLHFENASLHLEAGQLTVSRRDGSIDIYGEEAGTGGGANPMAFTHEWHQAIIENFVDTLNGQDQLIVSGHEALHAHALIDAILLSSKHGSIEKLALW